MNGTPLHPVIVHVPLVLALVAPVAIGWAAWRRLRGATDRRTWLAAALLQVVIVGSAFAALRTGGEEEERVEQVVPEAAIETHEERAELFTGAAVVAAVLVAGAALTRGRVGVALGGTATAAAVLVGVLGVAVGAAGGDLVYRHGAAAVYVAPAGGGGPGDPAAAAPRHDDDDDD